MLGAGFLPLRVFNLPQKLHKTQWLACITAVSNLPCLCFILLTDNFCLETEIKTCLHVELAVSHLAFKSGMDKLHLKGSLPSR